MIKTHIKWPKNIEDARQMQERDKNGLLIEGLKSEPRYIAGVDAAFSGDTVFGAACLYRYPDLVLVEQSSSIRKAVFPYIPGYLLFVEGPAIAEALAKLNCSPELLLIDGHGIAHPRGIGSASHLGILLGIPAIGCAKTKLVGRSREPGREKGSWSEILYQGGIAGAVLRTKSGVKPVFVSPGHKIDLPDAIRLVLGCTEKYRIPEPLRCAHMLSKRIRQNQERLA